MSSLRFLKGHGTENDFVLIPDPEGAVELTPVLVRALCDRRSGLGADGVIRVVPTDRMTSEPHVAALAPQAAWFMDYRNADGSQAEMCGNGVRVFGLFLLQEGLVLTHRAPSGALTASFPVATRAGVREVVLAPDGRLTVAMGPADVTAETVSVKLAGRTWRGTRISLGNPHVVVLLDDGEGSAADLLAGLSGQGEHLGRPLLSPDPPGGANVEFVVRRAPDHVAMRVHERGVGETRSCGTGACAAAVAAVQAPGPWTCDVDVPGGRLTVSRDGDGMVWLTGPAVILAEGSVREEWVRART